MNRQNSKIISYLLMLFLLLLISYPALSETVDSIFFKKEISQIIMCIDSMKKVKSDSVKFIINDQITKYLEIVLKNSDSYTMHFDTLKHIGKVYSPDNKFRVFSWNIPLTDGKNKFFAIIQANSGKDKLCKLYKLKDNSLNFKGNITDTCFTADNWYGALYYEILPRKIGKKIIYTLLGMHFNDLFSNRKIIESMYFDDNGDPVFGAPIFLYEGRMQNRVVFEYSINAVMSLKYNERLKMIVFDHLSPPSQLYNGNFKFYGPDFTFDGFKFGKNKWVHYQNVNYHK